MTLLAQGASGHTMTVERRGSFFVGKRLVPRLRDDDAARAGLEVEARILSALDGRGAPRLVASGADDEGPWLVMEQITLPSLASEASGGNPPLVEAVALASFRALALVHEAEDERGPFSVVHGDVSPSNVLVGRAPPDARLIDFGLASFRDSVPAPVTGVRGTPHFVAPEVARGEHATPQSDLFSLGLTLLQAASGCAPRKGTSLPMLLLEAGETSVLSYAELASQSLSRGLRDALVAVVAFEPSSRPASARDALLSGSW